MTSKYSAVLGLLCVVAGAGKAAAATLHVSERQAARKADGASWETAYTSLSAALNDARPGDEVWVAAGRYPGNFTLRSGVRLYGGFHGDETRRFDRDAREHDTILIGRGDAPVVTIEGVASRSRTVLDGFTIRDGKGFEQDGRRIGGGILVRGPVRALIAHNVIRNNNVAGRERHPVADGGGIGLVEGASAVIKDNLILRNSAGRHGGGIAVWDASDLSITNNTILHNDAKDGGAMTLYVANITVLNNLVAHNSSGLHYAGAGPSGPEVTYHLFHENGAYDYQGWPNRLEDAEGNLFRDPMFADSLHENYRLARRSPCRNAGTDVCIEAGDEDFYGLSRIISQCADIGAAEARPVGTVKRDAMGTARPDDPPLDLDVVHVNQYHREADDLNSGRTWKSPKRSIMAGIDAARRNGGEVRVTAGAYNEVIFLPRGVRLRGGYEKEKDEMVQKSFTSVSGEPKVRSGLAMVSTDASLERFSFIGGPSVACGEGTPTIRQCLVSQSRTAALRSDDGSPLIINCRFTGNTPAMELIGGAPEVRACTIIGNAGEEAAGGIVLAGGSTIGDALITGNVLAGNVGGAISMRETAARIVNNTFYGNYGRPRFVSLTGDTGPTAGAVDSTRSALTFVNNIVTGSTGGVQDRGALTGFPVVRGNCAFGNEGFNWRLEHRPDPTGRDGNLRADPRLVAPERGDFHILLDSPCRNAGYASVSARDETDIDGERRIQGRMVDIGADENEVHGYSRLTMVVHVAPDGNDTNTGASWAKAVRTVQKAVERIAESGIGGGEVWVAAGQYRRPVVLDGFVALYGGFSGREDRREQRQPDRNLTELIGDAEYTPVVMMPGAAFNVVDGFTIRDGFGTGDSFAAAGGIVCHPGSSTRIANSILAGNAAEYGHALGADHAWVSLTNSTIAQNGAPATGHTSVPDTALGDGPDDPADAREPFPSAAVLFHHSLGIVAENAFLENNATGLRLQDRSGVSVRDNVFAGNRGDAGGVLSREGYSEIANNVFTGNAAARWGGGLALEYSVDFVHDNLIRGNTCAGTGGGFSSVFGNPLIVNNTVVENAAKDAGAAYIHNAAALYNNIFAFNSSGVAAESILFQRTRPTLVMRLNCVFGNAGYETRGLPRNDNISGNLQEDPKFLGLPGEDFHLESGSPCIDRGTVSFVAAGQRDIDGQPRLLGEAVDIGADERVGATALTGVYRNPRPSLPPLGTAGRHAPGKPVGSPIDSSARDRRPEQR